LYIRSIFAQCSSFLKVIPSAFQIKNINLSIGQINLLPGFNLYLISPFDLMYSYWLEQRTEALLSVFVYVDTSKHIFRAGGDLLEN